MRGCVLWHSEGCEEGTLLLQQLCRKPTQAHVLRGLILAPMQLLTFAQDNTFPSMCLILGPLLSQRTPTVAFTVSSNPLALTLSDLISPS